MVRSSTVRSNGHAARAASAGLDTPRLVVQVTKWPKDALAHARALLPGADDAERERAIAARAFLDRAFEVDEAVELVGALMAAGGCAYVLAASRTDAAPGVLAAVRERIELRYRALTSADRRTR